MIQLIANGANGVLAAKPVETEFNPGKLKFQPNLEEDHVLEIQGETVMSEHVLKRFLCKVCTQLLLIIFI